MSYSVKVEPSGHVFSVDEGESILDAGLRQGVNLPYGCRDGACGACLGKLKTGQVTYPGGRPIALSEEDEEQNMAVFCQAHAQSDLIIESDEVESGSDIQIKTLPCRISELRRLNHDVMLVMLKLPEAERMQFMAGQYIDFLLDDDRKRAFSLANAPHEDKDLELHIRHVENGRFTGQVFESLKVKDIMRIEGPFGQFFLREDSDRPIIFMAGGTGFAPIKGIIEHALAAGITRPMHLYWGVREREDLYMHELAQQWADEHAHIEYCPVLSATADESWSGRRGHVHSAIIADFPDLSGYEIYASGPPAMVYAGRDSFTEQGLDLDHYYSDAFEFSTD
ncbi:2-polyprenylphenol hydroxylase and related flavodoxin oxidoreductases / CDP-6-deoxy-delta-3,4-glucoseen reductase-like [hydrothermal vent metagenome]|uniref:2-polyprenylphenol hydroxylase and related flavodoxin oxidoreductases / CDP-6-deoxy-delta-3,4-glucoseen reductase-like n=1 Tax=hydrothermal vent metagenome TaxID=652676 RepID=A0A3B1C591_9ZZZZ